MIRKLINRVNDRLEDRVRRLVRPLNPGARVVVILTMLVLFGGLSIYTTVSSIHNIGKGKGEKMQIEQIEALKLQLKQQRDSINHQKNNFDNGTGEFE